jgi:preprotein translocase subunit YajC
MMTSTTNVIVFLTLMGIAMFMIFKTKKKKDGKKNRNADDSTPPF